MVVMLVTLMVAPEDLTVLLLIVTVTPMSLVEMDTMMATPMVTLEAAATRISISLVKDNISDTTTSALMLVVKIPTLTLIRNLLTIVMRMVTIRTKNMVRTISVTMMILMPVAFPVSLVDPRELSLPMIAMVTPM